MNINPGQILSLALASLPTILTVLLGILINNSRLSDLRADFTSRFSDVNSRIDDLRSSQSIDSAFLTTCARTGNPSCTASKKYWMPVSNIWKSANVRQQSRSGYRAEQGVGFQPDSSSSFLN